MPKPLLSKVAGWGQQDTAVGFYRIVQPLRFLKREKLAKDCRIIPFSGANTYQKFEFNNKLFMQLAEGAEVFWTTMVVDDEQFLKMMNLRKWAGFKWVVDMDDNMYAVPQDNPAAKKLIPHIHRIERCLMAADALTVSVPSLKEVYSRFNPHIFIQKNGLDFALWDEALSSRPKRKGSKVRIGWRGAYGHRDDLEMIAPVLHAITQDYPEVELVSFGAQPTFATEHHDWVDALAYPKKLASLNLDIALVPLIDSSYNRCKSNLNWLENAALSTALVYSPTENQKNLPGIAASNSFEWYEALSSLIEKKALRRQMGQECAQFVRANYDMRRTIQDVATFLATTQKRPEASLERIS